MKNKNKTVWSKRLKGKSSKAFQRIGSSINIDKRLYKQDIFASTVHTQMLIKQKIIPSSEGKKIIKGLKKIKDLIDSKISDSEICLFMKGTPDAPQCGFSMAVSNMLKILEVDFKGINVLEDQSLRDGIKEFSDWPTIPQLYIKKKFMGGCDIVKEMYENGQLQKVLEDQQIKFKK